MNSARSNESQTPSRRERLKELMAVAPLNIFMVERKGRGDRPQTTNYHQNCCNTQPQHHHQQQQQSCRMDNTYEPYEQYPNMSYPPNCYEPIY